MRPSQAAETILAAGVVDLADLAARATQRDEASTPSADPATASDHAKAEVDAFVSAARRLDVPAMDRILDEAFASERFEAAVEHVVFPALRAVGDGWADGSLDVSSEHAASETVRRRLARFYDAVGSTGASDVIVGLPPGGHHEIGALAFAVAARRRGVDVLYLGADIPLTSWLTAVETSLAPVAVVGVVAAADGAAAAEVVATLRTASRPPAIVLGGPRARDAGVADSVVLPSSLDDAVTAVLGLVTPAT
jgi:methanogenic corrinoid protein MtbC1